MVRGRPPKPGTAEQKAAARRERVRNNVRALRERRKRETTIVTGIPLHDPTALRKVTSVSNSEDESFDSDQASEQAVGMKQHGRPNTKRSLYSLNSRDQRRLILGLNVDTKGLYAVALLSCMRESFLPDSVYLPAAVSTTNGKPWESKQFLWTPCAFWISRAFSKASSEDSGVLRTVLLAIGTMMKSLEYSDSSLRVSALELYRRALLEIRKQLDPLIVNTSARPRDSVSLYLACHAAAMFELLLSSDLSSTMHHLRGVSQLICHLGDGRDEEGQTIAWLLLQDYRFAEMALCMKYRYSSFSNIKRQQFEANTFGRLDLSKRSAKADGYGSHNLLVNITDIADSLSAIMVQLDSIQTRLHKVYAATIIRKLLVALEEIWRRFEILHTSLTSHYGTFLRKDPGADGPIAGSLKFKTFDVGAAWCYNLMVQTYCLETSIEATILLQRTDPTVTCARHPDYIAMDLDDHFLPNLHNIPIVNQDLQLLRRLQRSVSMQLTQCIQYFLQTDKGMTGQALAIFPLDAATCMLAVEMSRLIADLRDAKTSGNSTMNVMQIQKDIATVADAQHFCQQMQERARAFGLPGLGSNGQDFVQTLRDDQALYGSWSTEVRTGIPSYDG